MAKKDQYYEGFVSMIQTSCDSIRLLEQFMKQYDFKKLPKITVQLSHFDEMVRKQHNDIMNLTSHDFLPPLDQEDVLSILQNLARMARNIYHLGTQIEVYRLPLLRPDILKGIALAQEQYLLILQAMNEWKQKKKASVMKGCVVQMQTNMLKADSWYREAMKNLFSQGKQPLDTVIYCRLYDQLKELFSACETMRSTIAGIMIKYS